MRIPSPDAQQQELARHRQAQLLKPTGKWSGRHEQSFAEALSLHG